MNPVVHCFQIWRHYLLGNKFTVRQTMWLTHNPEEVDPCIRKMARVFGDFEWVHKHGRENLVADALSRKGVDEYVADLILVENDFLAKVKTEFLNKFAYQRTVKLVGADTI